MHWVDNSIFVFFIILIVCFGLLKSKKIERNSENFILAGRKLSLPGLIATLVTTWYGGILGIGENTYQFGIQTWIIFGCPYYIFAILFAFYLIPKIRDTKLLTIPDHFNLFYGKKTGIISAIYIFVLATPAPYLLSLGILLQYFFQIPLGWGVILASILSLLYVWNGGLSAVVKTDILQFIFMFVGFILLLVGSWKEFGAPTLLFSQLPKDLLSPTGGNSIQYIFVWFFIALWTFVDPGFHQRALAAESRKTARNGILISIGFWIIFDILTVITGLYAISILNNPDSLFIYPLLALKVLPIGLVGIFFVSLFSIIMSTIDSFGLISATTFGRDILWRIETQRSKRLDPLNHIKKGLIISTFLSILLVMSIPSVVKLWYTIGSVFIPGLLLPYLFTLFKQKPNFCFTEWTLILPVLVSLIWYFFGQINGSYFLMIEPFYPGLIVSACFIIFQKFFKNNQDPFSISAE